MLSGRASRLSRSEVYLPNWVKPPLPVCIFSCLRLTRTRHRFFFVNFTRSINANDLTRKHIALKDKKIKSWRHIVRAALVYPRQNTIYVLLQGNPAWDCRDLEKYRKWNYSNMPRHKILSMRKKILIVERILHAKRPPTQFYSHW